MIYRFHKCRILDFVFVFFFRKNGPGRCSRMRKTVCSNSYLLKIPFKQFFVRNVDRNP
ncbi:hypothetical protein LEP1GSC005_3814 [Leptospira santarosai str. ST188]|uniref:Uncharacterized protein n=1 Tax=Leptospira santarosai serovar Arenal str. MAVJ 401 TaxID=1049976 RepID=M6JJ36_9LEPT|nr:hypothetical protein LEP1GSC068_3131 [Leptospira sp. Fiocruz LV3954]EMF89827.1 hypothetical protein LEP1GSC005_3814 [Leptospira santarosai str. ST188]EMI68792.1 hypothetical protein LEP1GSC076_2331 [Leptospira sp. Fiocruz LV4135]EMJ50628.1 hypothetical protein LEP1GSC169_3508 [Leptospira santarosai str. HAI1349]EMN21721.1 hypothetical protein LEP1GSC063_3779 [Leptospira santarosai serovar Arenal str. MAVJ 401]EMO15854.1 hypothetical protein LEP1GSC165_0613 [Leptospira santarosai str. CBC523